MTSDDQIGNRQGEKMLTCYVTGLKIDSASRNGQHSDVYFFGSPNHINLPLSSESFAHFIIRAKNDLIHQQIVSDIEEASKKIECFLEENKDNLHYTISFRDYPVMETDKQIHAYTQKCVLDHEMAGLLIQKAESGIRILRKMREGFQKTGKLS